MTSDPRVVAWRWRWIGADLIGAWKFAPNQQDDLDPAKYEQESLVPLSALQAAEAEIGRLREALEPFADIADLADAEAEGLDDGDEFNLMFHDYLMATFTLWHFRAARAAATPAPKTRAESEIARHQGGGLTAISFQYRNYRGETSERTVFPDRLWHGSTKWHPETQWFLSAFDVDKQAQRDFALRDIVFTPSAATPAQEGADG